MQLTEMKGPSLRGEAKWMALATISLPVPDSPVMSTVEREGAARSTSSSTAPMTLERPMILCTAKRSSRFWRSIMFSRWALANWAALPTVSMSSSLEKGLVT